MFWERIIERNHGKILAAPSVRGITKISAMLGEKKYKSLKFFGEHSPIVNDEKTVKLEILETSVVPI